MVTGCALLGLGWLFVCPSGWASIIENFDSYATGSQLHGQGGWKGWDNTPSAGALASSAQSVSAPNSVAITGGSDLVHEYQGMDSGRWIYSVKQYIPSASTGSSFFILMNSYQDGGAGNSWAVQTHFDMATSLVISDYLPTGTSLSLIKDRWVDLVFDVNLAANSVTEYYGGQVLGTHAWQGPGSPVVGIRAVDLYANGAGPVYYDDFAVVPEPSQVSMIALTALMAAGYVSRKWLVRR